MAKEDTLAFQLQKLHGRLLRAEVAVSGDLLQRNVRKHVPDALRIPPAVPQMENALRPLPLQSGEHMLHVAMGIGEYQYLHKVPSFGFDADSIPPAVQFGNRICFSSGKKRALPLRAGRRARILIPSCMKRRNMVEFCGTEARNFCIVIFSLIWTEL
ncbi:hypothetical protein SDC9_168708 [bioreactor metagenome]|uniref:Uncharacterized protein n=1 Tax=bioreactor metagenome TaxID=1076179 RepID=A0A645G699_9ZZZZ